MSFMFTVLYGVWSLYNSTVHAYGISHLSESLKIYISCNTYSCLASYSV